MSPDTDAPEPALNWETPDALPIALQRTLRLDLLPAAQPPRETIIPTERQRSFEDPEAVIAQLPRLAIAEGAGGADRACDLLVEGLIGEGGMGKVMRAEQVPMGRTVAVKALKDPASGGTRAILQEAWLTGWLEHPNIIPIYTLGRDAQGSPLIVMKRIEGREWWSVLHQGDDPTSPSDDAPLFTLDRHLDVLIEVCHAVEYAHSRGIVHRDLKPENVMIGRFGEVYVLDWGIAISLNESLEGRLPMADESLKLAGTPAYMAPEMVAGDEPLDARADVYLLGAILHEILTGQPPHQGPSMNVVLFRAYHSTPHDYPEHIPAELAAICHRAMARDRKDRYPTARALREAVEAFREHRHSIELTRQTLTSLATLRRLARAHTATEDTPDTPHARSTREVFTECRFGFQQALRIWAENTTARAGLVEALKLMIEVELADGQLATAQQLHDELARHAEPPEALTRQLAEAHAAADAQHQRVAALEHMERDLSLEVGRRGRRNLVIILAVAWTLLPIIAGLREDFGGLVPTHSSYLIGGVRVVVIALIGIAWFRRQLFANTANRRIVFGLIGLLTTLLLTRVIAAIGHLDIPAVYPVEVLSYGLFTLLIALQAAPRLAPASAIYMLGALLMSLLPQHGNYIMGACNLSVLVIFGWAWRSASPPSRLSATPPLSRRPGEG